MYSNEIIREILIFNKHSFIFSSEKHNKYFFSVLNYVLSSMLGSNVVFEDKSFFL